MINFIGKLNKSIKDIVLEKVPKNAKYTSPNTHKDVLNIISNQLRAKIRKGIGDAKFCILVDEAKDASNKEHMAIVSRFVDIEGFLRGRLFSIVHVTNTIVARLKKEISDALGRYDLHIHDMRGQGHDGASSTRGYWNGLQALLLKDCSFVITVLENMVNDGTSNSIRVEASGALIAIKSFDFIFILHLMHKIMGITNLLCRALEEKSLDILSAMDYVSTTKTLIRTLREEGFDILLSHVKEFCVKYDIEIPHMEARYNSGTGRAFQQNDSITVEYCENLKFQQ
ncbi:uncharacterized protein [Primulina huaijiensis]|uniref:uncharacterized protein n=1 Tax=Primulina huaijiensis TaxID=1492673 RepID=UPI003CC70D49